MTNNQALLKKHFPDIDWSFNFLLAKYSYFKLGGAAEIFYKIEDLELLKTILLFCEKQQIPWTIVGGLSNVIVADSGIKGLVLQMACSGFQLIEESKKHVVFKAGAGIKTNLLVSKSANLGATGLEGFIGVPGRLGGAIYNNAHYLDFLIGDYIKEVIAFHVKNNEEVVVSHENCAFAYEQSIFQEEKQLVILAAVFHLPKGEANQIKQKIEAAQKKRLDTQPLHLPSSGCVFQNPSNTDYFKKLFPQFADQKFIPAGFLIDQAGLKNQREGAIVVSEKHAAFLVNMADQFQVSATSADFKKLVKKIQSAVKEKFQVELKEEIFYLGKD